jgi:hypothetical protein
MSTDQGLNITFVRSLELTNKCIWQQLLERRRDKLRETGIVRLESEEYIELNREKPVLT